MIFKNIEPKVLIWLIVGAAAGEALSFILFRSSDLSWEPGREKMMLFSKIWLNFSAITLLNIPKAVVLSTAHLYLHSLFSPSVFSE